MVVQIPPLFVPIPGGMELVVIFGLAILLFGANKLPALARSSGQAIGEFKRGREELEHEIQDAAQAPTSESTASTDQRDE